MCGMRQFPVYGDYGLELDLPVHHFTHSIDTAQNDLIQMSVPAQPRLLAQTVLQAQPDLVNLDQAKIHDSSA